MVAAKLKGRTLQFTPQDKLQSWATWHENEEGTEQIQELNQAQANTLAKNISETKEQLIKTAIQKHLGHVPSLKKAKRYLRIQGELIQDEKVQLWWVWWRKTCVAAYTDPQPSIKDKRYYLTWYFKVL